MWLLGCVYSVVGFIVCISGGVSFVLIRWIWSNCIGCILIKFNNTYNVLSLSHKLLNKWINKWINKYVKNNVRNFTIIFSLPTSLAKEINSILSRRWMTRWWRHHHFHQSGHTMLTFKFRFLFTVTARTGMHSLMFEKDILSIAAALHIPSVSLFEGIFQCKFNPWSNTQRHERERASSPTDSLCSFSNLRKDCTITIHCSQWLHQETTIKKPLIAAQIMLRTAPNFSNSTERIPAHSLRHQTSASLAGFVK